MELKGSEGPGGIVEKVKRVGDVNVHGQGERKTKERKLQKEVPWAANGAL